MTEPRATRREWENALDFFYAAKALTPRERNLVNWLARQDTTDEDIERAAKEREEET